MEALSAHGIVADILKAPPQRLNGNSRCPPQCLARGVSKGWDTMSETQDVDSGPHHNELGVQIDVVW